MKQLFLLSKENIDIAKEEVLSLTNSKNFELVDNIFLIENKTKGLESRLAYTNRIYQVLFESTYGSFDQKIENFSWGKFYKKDFCVRASFGKGKLIDGYLKKNNLEKKRVESKLAGSIWAKLKNPKVNLDNPKTLFEVFFTRTKVCVALLLYTIDKDYLSRKANLRPEFHPSSLSPKLARCMINLTGIKKGPIIDPFCGSGGILIEAGFMGLKPMGFDLDQIMLNRTKINLDYYGVKKYSLMLNDATKNKKKLPYVVCDLPYGKNTKKQDLNRLYSLFLNNLHKNLKYKAVIGFPSFINHKKLIKQSKLELLAQFTFYLHKSLSKTIVVIKK